jgi:hypothetical protein
MLTKGVSLWQNPFKLAKIYAKGRLLIAPLVFQALDFRCVSAGWLQYYAELGELNFANSLADNRPFNARNLGRETEGANPLAFAAGGNFPALIKEKSWLAVAQLCNHRDGAVCSLERHKFAVNHSTISLLSAYTHTNLAPLLCDNWFVCVQNAATGLLREFAVPSRNEIVIPRYLVGLSPKPPQASTFLSSVLAGARFFSGAPALQLVKKKIQLPPYPYAIKFCQEV